jgi:hypothetical protein
VAPRRLTAGTLNALHTPSCMAASGADVALACCCQSTLTCPIWKVASPLVQPAPTRHLALGNLLPAVTRTAIELAFSQYGSLEEVKTL